MPSYADASLPSYDCRRLMPSYAPMFMVVSEMKRMKLEKKGSLAERLLRLMKPRSAVQESIVLSEQDARVTLPKGFHHEYQRIIRISALETERKKAEGLMEWQRHRFAGH